MERTAPGPASRAPADVLRSYFVLLYFGVFAMMAMFWPFTVAETPALKAYILVATAAYAALYTLVPLGLTALANRLLRPASDGPVWRRRLVFGLAYLAGTLTLLTLYADYRVYSLYEYHLNGFVWNLVTTSGGIAALGATTSTQLTVAWQVSLFFVGVAAALWLLLRHQSGRGLVTRRTLAMTASALMLVLAGEEVVYAYSTHTGQESVIQAAEAVPFHLRTGASKLFERFGIAHTAMSARRVAGGKVNYPGQIQEAKTLAKYPNVIMLVAESFRWDLLDPEITPNLWRFSERALRFENHYSGGARTRMGLFSMFYGLYSPYWYSFERDRVAPALMNFIRGKDYQLAMHTSQSFNYPELRHTVFAGVDEQNLREIQDGEPWQRDIRNIDELIGKLDARDPQRPFYNFMFFESTHAPYTFPQEAVIRPDYEPDLDYIRMNLQDNIEGIHARYINAAHHVDHEVGRLLDALEARGMLNDTIVMFTGDHGEEFMEKGHWGHGRNKSFPEEQIRVPLVMWLPGHAPEVVEHRTSHVQIAPTLLAALGVTQDPHSYSSGTTLFDELPYFVVGDYNYMAVIDEQYKLTFPFTGGDFFRYLVDDRDDRRLSREARQTVVAQYKDTVDAVFRESERFIEKR